MILFITLSYDDHNLSHLTSRHITSHRITSHPIPSRHVTSRHLTSPQTSPHTSSHLCACQVVICGQASSHCQAFSVRDVVSLLIDSNPDIGASNIILMKDGEWFMIVVYDLCLFCCSPLCSLFFFILLHLYSSSFCSICILHPFSSFHSSVLHSAVQGTLPHPLLSVLFALHRPVLSEVLSFPFSMFSPQFMSYTTKLHTSSSLLSLSLSFSLLHSLLNSLSHS